MPYRHNPFFRYQNQYLGQGFNGLASAMFPDGADPRLQPAAAESTAKAEQARSVAGYNNERTRGERFANDVRQTSPTSIAELMLGGGVLQDDQVTVNPNYQPRQATNFADILTAPATPAQEASPVFNPNRSAKDKLSEAIVWAANNKIPLDQVLKAAGLQGYLQRAAGADPDRALPYAPFVGVTPNTQTALTTTRQDSISARDSAEDIAKQETVNRTRVETTKLEETGKGTRNTDDNQTKLKQEDKRQGGDNYRASIKPVDVNTGQYVFLTPEQGKRLGVTPNAQGQYILQGATKVGTGQDIITPDGKKIEGREKTPSGSKAPKAIVVPDKANNRMRTALETALKLQKIDYDEDSLTALLAESGREFQISNNAVDAVDKVVQRLKAGEQVNGVSRVKTTSTVLGYEVPLTTGERLKRSATASVTAPAVRQPPAAAIEFLRQNPNLKADFEAKYGPGSAAQHLK